MEMLLRFSKLRGRVSIEGGPTGHQSDCRMSFSEIVS
jgi:hypothetical protein